MHITYEHLSLIIYSISLPLIHQQHQSNVIWQSRCEMWSQVLRLEFPLWILQTLEEFSRKWFIYWNMMIAMNNRWLIHLFIIHCSHHLTSHWLILGNSATYRLVNKISVGRMHKAWFPRAMSSSRVVWHHAHSEVRTWLVDSLLRHNAEIN